MPLERPLQLLLAEPVFLVLCSSCRALQTQVVNRLMSFEWLVLDKLGITKSDRCSLWGLVAIVVGSSHCKFVRFGHNRSDHVPLTGNSLAIGSCRNCSHNQCFYLAQSRNRTHGTALAHRRAGFRFSSSRTRRRDPW